MNYFFFKLKFAIFAELNVDIVIIDGIIWLKDGGV